MQEKVFCEAGSNIADHEYMYELSESGKVIETEYQKLALRRYSFAELKTALQECGFREFTKRKDVTMRTNAEW